MGSTEAAAGEEATHGIWLVRVAGENQARISSPSGSGKGRSRTSRGSCKIWLRDHGEGAGVGLLKLSSQPAHNASQFGNQLTRVQQGSCQEAVAERSPPLKAVGSELQQKGSAEKQELQAWPN